MLIFLLIKISYNRRIQLKEKPESPQNLLIWDSFHHIPVLIPKVFILYSSDINLKFE
jgi:hypothetical protein